MKKMRDDWINVLKAYIEGRHQYPLERKLRISYHSDDLYYLPYTFYKEEKKSKFGYIKDEQSKINMIAQLAYFDKEKIPVETAPFFYDLGDDILNKINSKTTPNLKDELEKDQLEFVNKNKGKSYKSYSQILDIIEKELTEHGFPQSALTKMQYIIKENVAEINITLEDFFAYKLAKNHYKLHSNKANDMAYESDKPYEQIYDAYIQHYRLPYIDFTKKPEKSVWGKYILPVLLLIILCVVGYFILRQKVTDILNREYTIDSLQKENNGLRYIKETLKENNAKNKELKNISNSDINIPIYDLFKLSKEHKAKLENLEGVYYSYNESGRAKSEKGLPTKGSYDRIKWKFQFDTTSNLLKITREFKADQNLTTATTSHGVAYYINDYLYIDINVQNEFKALLGRRHFVCREDEKFGDEKESKLILNCGCSMFNTYKGTLKQVIIGQEILVRQDKSTTKYDLLLPRAYSNSDSVDAEIYKGSAYFKGKKTYIVVPD